MKIPTTFDQQLELMSERGLVIENENECLHVLRAVNYYRLSAYLLPFKRKDNNYASGTTFQTIHSIYLFDSKLRFLIFAAIEEIEIFLRTQLAYFSAHEKGALGYLDEINYSEKHKHALFINNVSSIIDKNWGSPVIKHHKDVYGGNFPIWVIIEFFSIGSLSYFYGDWIVRDKKRFAKQLYNSSYTFVDSWLKCITVLRNRCAHYTRLYYTYFTDAPRIPSSVKYKCSYRVFDQLMMLKFLYPHKSNWNMVFVTPLTKLIAEHKDSIILGHIGFPENWVDILSVSV